MKSKRTIAISVGVGVGVAVLGQRLWKSAEQRRKNRAIRSNQTILILGAGFGGMAAATELASLLPARETCQITLVDQNNYLLFTPMLTEVAGGELDPRHIVAPARSISSRINYEQGAVKSVDLAKKTVVLGVGADKNITRTLQADHLVIALGSVANYHHIEGLREHSVGMKNLADAAAIRNRVLSCLEQANWEKDAATRKELLTFVVGGGGYTGVETMAAINDLARSAAQEYANIRQDEITSLIIEPQERLMTELSEDLAEYGQKKLEERGVRVLLKTGIKRATENFVEIDGGTRFGTRTIVWAGGITPNPIIASLDCAKGKQGGILVDPCCQVLGHPGVWALGDCAEIPKQGGKGNYAPTAQNATREGAVIAGNIVAEMRGGTPEPFVYEPVGELALVGRHSGVAKILGQRFSGPVAWAMWRAIYLAKMPTVAQRTRIAVDWILDGIFGRNIAEFPIDHAAVGESLSPPVVKSM